jgi:carbamoyltransferase
LSSILGLSPFSRDPAAALALDGEVVAAAQEERLTRRTADHGFPVRAAQYCLSAAGLRPDQLDFVGFSEKPLLKFDRVVETFLAIAPAGFGSFREVLPPWLAQGLHAPREAARALPGLRRRFAFAERQECQAACAFYPSPFAEAAILVTDCGAEWATSSHGTGRGNTIELTHEQRFPHSLGLLLAACAGYAGFPGDGRELIDLAPCGDPRFVGLFLGKVIDLKPDGSFRLDTSYLDVRRGSDAATRRFHELLGAPPRSLDGPVRDLDRDLAASVQRVAEEVVLRAARHLKARTGLKNLCLAGDRAGISATSDRLRREGPFERVWIQPAAGDAGGALGVALLIWHQLLGKPRDPAWSERRGPLLGPSYSDQEIRLFLDGAKAPCEHVPDDEDLCRRAADALARGQIVGWFQGRMEFGHEPFGARSILADPRDPEVPARVDERIKLRARRHPSGPSAPGPRKDLAWALEAGTADGGHDGLYARLLGAFHERTGCPRLFTAPFSVGAEPVVCSPRDAFEAFMASEIDLLCMGHFVLSKAAQPAQACGPDPSGSDEMLRDLLRHPGTGAPLRVEGDRAIADPGGEAFERKEGIWQMFWPHETMGSSSDVTRAVRSFYEENPFPNYEEHDSLRSLVEKSRRGQYARALDRAVPYNSTVLEVGCGTGQLSNFLGIACRRVVGTDMSLGSLRLGERFRAKHGLSRVRFVQMNLFRPCFGPEAFDVILCNGVLHHTSDPFGGFRALVPLLKPGGYFVVGLYNRYGRLATDLRRAFFRLTGGRGQWVDPVLRSGLRSGDQRRAWFADQYRNPHESKHTIREVLGWFERCGLDFVRGVPPTTPEPDEIEGPSLFEPRPRGTALDHFIVQARQVLIGGEGGFFLMIGRRRRDQQKP